MAIPRADTTGQDAFNKWKGSPPYNAIMLGAFTKIGLGSAFINLVDLAYTYLDPRVKY